MHTPIPAYWDPTGQPTLGTVTIPMLTYQTSFPGGDTQFVGNFEYRIPIAPHVSASIFGDVGCNRSAAPRSIAAEFVRLRHAAADICRQQHDDQSTLPFQPGTNFKLRTSAGVEIVVQLPIVQAPFRIYWAYNFNRMSQIINAPTTQFPGNPNNTNPLNPPCDSIAYHELFRHELVQIRKRLAGG